MRRVNLITWDLVKKEFNLTDCKKGEVINIIDTQTIWTKADCGFYNTGKTNYKQIIAR